MDLKVVSTLLQSGFQNDNFDVGDLEAIASNLLQELQAQQGILGFGTILLHPAPMQTNESCTAPSTIPDADDTAKTLLTLSLLGKPARVEQMIDHFRAKTGYFRTYLTERDASFSANCNALQAILYTSDVGKYNQVISETSTFLCESWFTGAAKDKWVGSSSSFRRVLMLITSRTHLYSIQ